jgi:hypothetical protein
MPIGGRFVMKRTLVSYSVLFIFVGLMVAGISCTNYTIPGRGSKPVSPNSCEGCHIDYDRLMEVYSPDTVAPAGGCGGEAPHYEPYDRVYMGGEGYEAFKASPHYSVGCTGCHDGVGDTGDKNEAHSGDFIRHPSMYFEDKCSSCHEEITANFTTSIHLGTGQMRKVAMRSGLSGAAEFDKLPAHQIEGYTNNCAICHGTCGNCHVVRPSSGGGGLSDGHNFIKTPNMLNVCVTCHTSRGGHAFLGVAPGTDPDVHQQAGFTCLACHDGLELHGDGQPVEQRYAYTGLPKCEDCHTNIAKANTYHSTHYDSFSCYVCHSQDYNNCGSCHVHAEGARIPSYMDFKIGINPIPDVKSGYKSKFTVVRRAPGAPDNWEEYGVAKYKDFDVLPTYNYTSPHNVQKWTSRTQGGTSCSSNCHLQFVDGDTINKELYLWKSDLLDWEIKSTEFMTMDGNVPSYWMK